VHCKSCLVAPGRGAVRTPHTSLASDGRGEISVDAHNETLFVIAVCIDNPDCLPVGIQG